jgi:hypothetical protein
MTSVYESMSTSLRSDLLEKLSAYQAASTSSAGAARSKSSDEESDAELAFRLIIESGRYASDEAVEGAVDEYIGGKPLAYITSRPFSLHLDLKSTR